MSRCLPVLLLFLLCDCGTSSGEAIAWSEEDWATAELPADNRFDYRKTAAARLVLLELHDGADGHDGSSGSERLASLRKQNDDIARLPQASSQASSASWEEAEGDEELPL